MKTLYYSLAIAMLFVFGSVSIEAVPISNSANLTDKSDGPALTSVVSAPTVRSMDSDQTSGSSSDKTSHRSRQLVVNSNVPTAATGLNSGTTAGIQNPLQALTLLQQVTNSGNNPLAVQAELQAQQQESIQLQNQNQQQNLLAAVQTQQDHVNTVQAAITNQSHMANGNYPGSVSLAALNPATQQLQQQLEAQKQQLLVKQQLLKQQIKPESQQLSPQQILISQILREPISQRPQLLEQIKQTQVKQQAQSLVNESVFQQQQPQTFGSQSTRAQQELMRYQTLIQLLSMAQMGGNPNRLGLNVDPTRSALPTVGTISTMGDSSILAAQMQQLRQAQQIEGIKQLLLLQRQSQQHQMMMLRQQMAMMNPFAF